MTFTIYVVGEYAVVAGLPLEKARLFVTTFLTTPEKVVNIPGVTPAIIAAAAKGAQWGYAGAVKYVW